MAGHLALSCLQLTRAAETLPPNYTSSPQLNQNIRVSVSNRGVKVFLTTFKPFDFISSRHRATRRLSNRRSQFAAEYATRWK